MRVLAIDPGYGRCGVAILEGEGSRVKLEYSACILTDAKIEFSLRLLTVANGIIDLIKRYAPDTIATVHSQCLANLFDQLPLDREESGLEHLQLHTGNRVHH